jgi:hypothetical protein
MEFLSVMFMAIPTVKTWALCCCALPINWWKRWIDFVKIEFQSNENIERHFIATWIQFNSIHANPYLQNFYKFNLPSGWWSFVSANWTVPSPTDTSEALKSLWQKETLDKPCVQSANYSFKSTGRIPPVRSTHCLLITQLHPKWWWFILAVTSHAMSLNATMF